MRRQQIIVVDTKMNNCVSLTNADTDLLVLFDTLAIQSGRQQNCRKCKTMSINSMIASFVQRFFLFQRLYLFQTKQVPLNDLSDLKLIYW